LPARVRGLASDTFRPIGQERDAPPVAVSRVGRDAAGIKRLGEAPSFIDNPM